jgi:NTP pyrophosphatase (non-canonical NTP hydrolase)
MTYGPNSDLVEEVLEFARRGIFLRPLVADAPVDCALVTSLEDAKALAWQKVYGKDEYLWTDVREKKMSEIKARARAIPEFTTIRSKLLEMLKEIAHHVRRTLDQRHRELLDDIVGDLFNCAYARAVIGGADEFWEQLFSTYRIGGWPCGWEGEYPSGRLVAYFPTVD